MGLSVTTAPRLWEMFVAYGKDRVSFTYELAARGFVFVVQPEAFVVHFRTPANGAVRYGHQPEEWMIGETCWPGMFMTYTGGGWLGIAPTGQRITMRSLDFWRIEGDLIRENWVLVDLLHVWDQLGVDVLARMRELGRRPG